MPNTDAASLAQPAASTPTTPTTAATPPANYFNSSMAPAAASTVPADAVQALYSKYNDAQQAQQQAADALRKAEQSRNDYLSLGNSLNNATPTPGLPAAALPAAAAAAAAAAVPVALAAAKVAGPAVAPTTPTPVAPVSPEQQQLAGQALQQSGLTAPTSQPTPPVAPPAAPPEAMVPGPTPPVDPMAPSAQPPVAATPPSPAATPTANLSNAQPDALNNLIFSEQELADFKKLTPKEQQLWIGQRNLQSKADAIGEIAIQAGMPNAPKFPKATYDRLEAIANLPTNDITGPEGDDLRYFRKTALWTLGLLNGSQNTSVPVKDLPGIKTIEAIASNPKESKDVRVAAAQSLQAMGRGNDKDMQATLARLKSNGVSLLAPWTWLRPRTPRDVVTILDATRRGVPIQPTAPTTDPTVPAQPVKTA